MTYSEVVTRVPVLRYLGQSPYDWEHSKFYTLRRTLCSMILIVAHYSLIRMIKI